MYLVVPILPIQNSSITPESNALLDDIQQDFIAPLRSSTNQYVYHTAARIELRKGGYSIDQLSYLL